MTNFSLNDFNGIFDLISVDFQNEWNSGRGKNIRFVTKGCLIYVPYLTKPRRKLGLLGRDVQNKGSNIRASCDESRGDDI